MEVRFKSIPTKTALPAALGAGIATFSSSAASTSEMRRSGPQWGLERASNVQCASVAATVKSHSNVRVYSGDS